MYVGMYEVEVGCLDAPQPCLGKPELLFTSGSNSIRFHSWSPDGQKVVYEHEDNVFIADWNGKNATKISTSPSYSGWPVWMSNGQEIAYQTNGTEGYHVDRLGVGVFPLIFMISDLTGRNQKIFAKQEALEKKGNFGAPFGLDWSPNGKNIVFQATKNNTIPALNQIFNYDLKTDQVKLISDAETGSYNPSFSPDGQWIIFTSDSRVYYAHADDGALLVKAFTQTNDKTVIYDATKDSYEWLSIPRWSPMGNWISFVMNDDIYIIRSDGTQLINVTHSPSIENYPNWRIAH